MKCACKREVLPSVANYVGSFVYEDYSYLLCFNCDCGSTRSCAIWLSEDAIADVAAVSIDEDDEPIAAE